MELRGVEIGKDRLCWVYRLGLHCTVVPILISYSFGCSLDVPSVFHTALLGARWLRHVAARGWLACRPHAFLRLLQLCSGAMLRRALACLNAPCGLAAASAVFCLDRPRPSRCVDSPTSATRWKTVEFRSAALHRCVAVQVAQEPCRYEVSPFHKHVRGTELFRWLDEAGKHRNYGHRHMCAISEALCPRLSCLLFPSHYQIAGQAAVVEAERRTSGGFGTTAQASWLLVYALLPACIDKVGPALRRKAYELLELLTTTATSDQTVRVTTCLGPAGAWLYIFPLANP